MKIIIKMEITLENNKYWVTSYLKNGYKEWHGFTDVREFVNFIQHELCYLKEEK